MVFHKLSLGKRNRRERVKRIDVMTEQVKKVLADVDQKLILMVRG